MFTSLGIYAESFEIPFLECTSEFYAAEGMTYMQQSDVPDYLKHVEVPFVSPLILFGIKVVMKINFSFSYSFYFFFVNICLLLGNLVGHIPAVEIE